MPADPIRELIRARGVADVRRAAQAWVGQHGCTGASLWRYDTERGLLIGDSAPDAAGRAALETGAVQIVDTTVYAPLFDDRGRPCGLLALAFQAGATAVEFPELIGRWFDLAGVALARAIEADTDRVNAQAYALTLPLLDEGVVLITVDGQVLQYNGAVETLVGWTADDVRGKGWTNCVYATEAERTAAQTAIAAGLMGKPSEGARRPLRRKNGTSFTAGIWSRFISDPAGGAPAVLGIIRDVTEHDLAHGEALREESLARLGRLARAIAHDVNNLMCAIGGHAELIEAWTTDERIRRSAALQLDATDQGARLTRQLLAFGGPSNTRVEPQSALGIVTRAVDLYRASAPPTLTVELTGDDGAVVDIDTSQIHQAVLNVLANAGQACGGRGRVRVDVARAALPGDLTWRAADAPVAGTEVARITVHDDGPGFPDVDFARLFEPFFTTRADGHGVGLAAVQSVIAVHRGAVRLVNDRGARVELFLPLSLRAEYAYADLVKAHGKGSGRVWIFDDQVQILEFSRISLAAQGYEVRVFSDLASLREAARTAPPTERPAGLVLDLTSPDGGGESVLSDLRAAGLEAPVLWISGGNFQPGAAPPGRFLAKPFTGNALAEAVSALLTAP